MPAIPTRRDTMEAALGAVVLSAEITPDRLRHIILNRFQHVGRREIVYAVLVLYSLHKPGRQVSYSQIERDTNVSRRRVIAYWQEFFQHPQERPLKTALALVVGALAVEGDS